MTVFGGSSQPSTLEARIAALEALVAQLGITVPANATAAGNAVAAEAQLRAQGDATLTAADTTERNARIAADQGLTNQIAAEAAARIAGDNINIGRLDTLALLLDQALGEAVVASTWAELQQIPADSQARGRAAKVYGPDAGTHVDPVLGGAPVPNTGIYAAVPGPGAGTGWKRIAGLEVADIVAAIATANATLDAKVATATTAATDAEADRVATAADRVAVAADKAVVAADRATVAADRGIVAADKATTIAARDTAVAAAAQAAATVNNPMKLADVATTRPFTGVPSGIMAIDGVPGVAGMRVWDWNNTNPAVRGMRIMAAGAWPRADDMNSAGEVNGATVVVKGGDSNYLRMWAVTSTVVTLDTDAIVAEMLPSGAQSLLSVAAQPFGTHAILADSNNGGRLGAILALLRGRWHPRWGAWRKWHRYNFADSGYQLNAARATIATGDRDPVLPANTFYRPAVSPGFSTPVASGGLGGNIWAWIKALKLHTNAIGQIELGINDFGLGAAVRATGGPGDPLIYRRNWQEVLSLALVETTAQIVVVMPQPFTDKDFIQGVNVTQWASDSPDGTIAGGARAANAKMFAEIRRLANRNSRLHVIDVPMLVYGADFCAEETTDCLDRQIPATLLGAAIPNSARQQIDDALHGSNLGRRRTNEVIERFLGLLPQRASIDDYQVLGTRFDHAAVVDGEWFHFETMANSANDTTFRVRGSGEHLFWQTTQAGILHGSTNYSRPAHEAMADAERSIRMKRAGALQRVLGFRGDVRLFFISSGNTYSASDIQLSSTTTDVDIYGEKFYNLVAKDSNAGPELAASQGIDLGTVGSPNLDTSGQLVFIYVGREDDLGTHRKPVQLAISTAGRTGGSAEPYNQVSGEQWIARTFRGYRNDSAGVAFTGQLHDGSGGAGNVLTVSTVPAGGAAAPFMVGSYVSGPSFTGGRRIVSQLTGTPGGVGTYSVDGAAVAGASGSCTLYPSVILSLANQPDGRLVDGTINFGTGEGMPICEMHFGLSRVATVTNISANFDLAQASTAGWIGGAAASGNGSIVGNVLTLAATTGRFKPGVRLAGTGVRLGTYIVRQLTGTTGGDGTYEVSVTLDVPSTVITTATQSWATIKFNYAFRARSNLPIADGATISINN